MSIVPVRTTPREGAPWQETSLENRELRREQWSANGYIQCIICLRIFECGAIFDMGPSLDKEEEYNVCVCCLDMIILCL